MKCKICKFKSPADTIFCPVCNRPIDIVKDLMTKKDFAVRRSGRIIRSTGRALVLLGVLIILMQIILSPWQDILRQPIFNIITIIIILNGIGLLLYKKWSYYTSIILFLAGLYVNALSYNKFGILVMLLLLYYIIRKGSRDILLRKCNRE